NPVLKFLLSIFAAIILMTSISSSNAIYDRYYNSTFKNTPIVNATGTFSSDKEAAQDANLSIQSLSVRASSFVIPKEDPEEYSDKNLPQQIGAVCIGKPGSSYSI